MIEPSGILSVLDSMNRLISTLLLLTAPAIALAERFESGTTQVPLLELYTSEGCSSCPPADRWLSELIEDPDLWNDYVPVALHVDYWDYLGWGDKFASAAFSDRQREYRRSGYTSGVYTPGVILGGQEWRSWRRATTPPMLERPRVGSLAISVENGEFEASFSPEKTAEIAKPTLHVVQLGFGLCTQIKAGENRGRELTHDFVVLDHQQFKANRSQSWTGTLERPELVNGVGRVAVAAWISDGGDPIPLQSVGGWINH